jgi:hypothetical protein
VTCSIRIQLHKVDGTVIDSGRTLPPKGSAVLPVDNLFDPEDLTNSYITVSVLDGEGIVGIELLEFAKAHTLMVLPAQETSNSLISYSAQAVS